jgi:hypothetical protein
MQPLPVLQTAIVPVGNETTLSLTWSGSSVTSFMVFLTFADFQNTKIRQFDIILNGNPLGPNEKSYTPSYLVASTISNSGWYRDINNEYNVILNATATSELPPMINAIEIYELLAFDSPATYPKDRERVLSLSLSHTHIFGALIEFLFQSTLHYEIKYIFLHKKYVFLGLLY